MGKPNIYPTGTTIYDPERAFNGYTLFPIQGVGAVLIDMNGNVIRTWKDFQGFPNIMLKGGNILGSLGRRPAGVALQDMADVTEIDWDGKVVWSFTRNEFVNDNGKECWVARQHHDFQRKGCPVYYVPGVEQDTHGNNTLILTHEDLYNDKISDQRLLDDTIIEVDWEENIIWRWRPNEHFDELGFSDEAKKSLYTHPNYHNNGGGESDWLHINSATYVGPNKWYDEGDTRFNPENIIWNSREANIIAITDKATGKIVWKMGPDFKDNSKLAAIGQIIGAHHAHIIPEGLPGAGNLLVFDNGGSAGYGAPCNTSPDGTKVDKRDHSRVLEINPVTLELVWSFTGDVWYGMLPPVAKSNFYSSLISSAQRLPNGNTLITEGGFFRVFEVTPEKDVVWEYIAPFDMMDGPKPSPRLYRSYRYPYDYVPQVSVPTEVPVEPVNNKTFRMPGAAEGMLDNIINVEGTWGFSPTLVDQGKGGAAF